MRIHLNRETYNYSDFKLVSNAIRGTLSLSEPSIEPYGGSVGRDGLGRNNFDFDVAMMPRLPVGRCLAHRTTVPASRLEIGLVP